MAIIAACGIRDDDNENFDRKLQGTWESNDKSVYSGTLYIDYNSITIKGYEESQTLWQGDDTNRPFKNFTKNTALKAYSEEGKIFITDAGILQEGIPYTYYTGKFATDEFLRFNFGDRLETLRKIQLD